MDALRATQRKEQDEAEVDLAQRAITDIEAFAELYRHHLTRDGFKLHLVSRSFVSGQAQAGVLDHGIKRNLQPVSLASEKHEPLF